MNDQFWPGTHELLITMPGHGHASHFNLDGWNNSHEQHAGIEYSYWYIGWSPWVQSYHGKQYAVDKYGRLPHISEIIMASHGHVHAAGFCGFLGAWCHLQMSWLASFTAVCTREGHWVCIVCHTWLAELLYFTAKRALYSNQRLMRAFVTAWLAISCTSVLAKQ